MMLHREKTPRRRRIALLFATIIVVNCGRLDPCGNDVVARIPSPSGSQQVIVFERDCGATTGFSTQVSVLPRGEGLREQPSMWTATEAGNVLIVDDDHGAAPSGPGGGPKVEVAWNGEREVVLTYHPRVRVFRALERVGNTGIRHQLGD